MFYGAASTSKYGRCSAWGRSLAYRPGLLQQASFYLDDSQRLHSDSMDPRFPPPLSAYCLAQEEAPFTPTTPVLSGTMSLRRGSHLWPRGWEN